MSEANLGAYKLISQITMLNSIINNALVGQGCSKEQALNLLAGCSSESLFLAAGKVRQKFFGNHIQLCMIVNAKSGVCDMNCRFCSQSGHNQTQTQVYPFLLPEDLVGQLTPMEGLAHNGGVVTSGGKLATGDIDKFITAVDSLRDKVSFDICASFGRLSESDLHRLLDAGIKRYHHNLETSEGFYPKICTTQKWSQRYETVKAALATGMRVCSGGLFGMGESWSDRIDLAISLRELGVDSIPINFLYPHSGTPLAEQPLLTADEALRIIAIYRLLLPDRTIRICGGRQAVLGSRQNEIFAAGANALMTGNYLTTAGTTPQTDRQMIIDAGMEL